MWLGFRGIKAWVSIIRLGNSLIIALASLTGYIVCGGSNYSVMILLSLSSFLIGAGGNAINDYFDREVDAISKPWRPIPSGVIKSSSARNVSIVLMCLGIMASLPLTPYNIILALAASLLLYLYSRTLKKLGVIGNLTIAFLSFLALIYGGVASERAVRSVLPATYAFLIILGREFIKGIEDVEGDLRYGVLTIANTYGVREAAYLGVLVLSGVVVISPLPILIDFCPNTALYSLTAFIGVDLPILLSILILTRNPRANAWLATRVLKVPLMSGLLAFFLGCLIW